MLEALMPIQKHLSLNNIPYVEEIIDAFKDHKLDYRVLGYGWCGTPIYMFKAGKGVKKTLLIGLVDPDEPVGVLALQVLLTKVFDQEPYLLDKYTWYFIPVADPCGARLNEGWFQDPYNTRLYILERFKVKVVDWKLPGSCNGYVFNELTPEALAVKKAIDTARPDLIVPLHNNDFSGLYFFLSRNTPELIRDLKNTASKLEIPIHRGEPAASYLEMYEEGFYREPTMCDEYHNCMKYSPNPRTCIEGLGETIYGYARGINPNVFSIVCETPYIYSKTLEDNTPSGSRLRDLYLDIINMVAPIAGYIESIVKKLIPHVDKKCPYLWEAEEYLLGWSSRLESLRRRIAVDERYGREASRAEEFDIVVVRGLWNTLLKLGIALRLLSRCSKDYPGIDVKEVIENLTEVFEELYTKLHRCHIEHIPLEKQVAMQLYTILLATRHIW